MFGLLGTFVIGIGIITWDEVKNQQRVPHPERYMYVALVWGVLGIIGELGAPELAALIGLGYIITLIYRNLGKPVRDSGSQEIAGRFQGQPAE